MAMVYGIRINPRQRRSCKPQGDDAAREGQPGGGPGGRRTAVRAVHLHAVGLRGRGAEGERPRVTRGACGGRTMADEVWMWADKQTQRHGRMF